MLLTLASLLQSLGLHSTVPSIQTAAIVCDDFRIAVVTNWFEYKKHKELWNIRSKLSFNIRGLLLKN